MFEESLGYVCQCLPHISLSFKQVQHGLKRSVEVPQVAQCAHTNNTTGLLSS